jgi:hypothetical protein
MFKHPLSFTFIGFYLNSLVDKGEEMPIGEVKKHLASNELLKYLQRKYALEFDMSLFTPDDFKKIENFFSSCFNSIDARKKFGVSNNGLCLLVAYCFEAAQRKEEDVIWE